MAQPTLAEVKSALSESGIFLDDFAERLAKLSAPQRAPLEALALGTKRLHVGVERLVIVVQSYDDRLRAVERQRE